MFIICFDLEGVFIPEIWINIAMSTGIEELKLTTRDISDFDLLMRRRLEILKENGITLKQIQKIISTMEFFAGAKEFYEWIRNKTQTLILSDSYIEFVWHFIKKLNFPLIICHNLETDENGAIINYNLRIKDMKKKIVQVFKEMNYDVIAVGDSYNDLGMLFEATHGILFRPPENIAKKYKKFNIITKYSELKRVLSNHLNLKRELTH